MYAPAPQLDNWRLQQRNKVAKVAKEATSPAYYAGQFKDFIKKLTDPLLVRLLLVFFAIALWHYQLSPMPCLHAFGGGGGYTSLHS